MRLIFAILGSFSVLGSALIGGPTLMAAENRGSNDCIVAWVVDGDTLECTDGRRIRLLLVDAPELGQGYFGKVARDLLESLAGVGVRLTEERDIVLRDRDGLDLAHLYTPEGININLELLRQGVAVLFIEPPNVLHVNEYGVAAEAARDAGVGLWSMGGFECEPANYRARRCPG